VIQTLIAEREASRAPFLNIENLIRASYLVVAILLIAAVILATEFRQASRWQATPEYLALEERDKQLAELRRYVTQGVTATRDYLINNRPNNAEVYDQELRRAKANATQTFIALNPWPTQNVTLTQMDHDLAEFWGMLDQTRLATVQEKSEQGFDYLHLRLFPIRNQVFQTLKILTDATVQDRANVTSRFARDRNRDLTYVFIVMGAVIVISLIMASGNLNYRRSYQLESRRKLEEVAKARDSLEQLSGRLLRIQEDERRKISRELHDGIGQTLTALRMEIHQVHFAASGALTGGEERLLRAHKLAEEAVRTVKDISLLLRPPLLDDLGLEPALGWLVDQFTRRTGIHCRFQALHLQEYLQDDLRTCVFRVIQEALNNCEKHASPTKIEILVEQKEQVLSINIEDDGAGFALNANNTPARHAGLGILGMRERAGLLGGNMAIRSSPGNGTKLTFNFPVARVGSLDMRKLPAAAASITA